MLIYPTFNPIAISLGPLPVHWYGLMYFCSFMLVLYGCKWRIRKFGHPFMTAAMVDGFLIYIILGTVIGGRLGYCLFYQPAFYWQHPLEILKSWTGGMSFHGGFIGVCSGVYLYGRKIGHKFLELTDFGVPFVPMCLFFGRMGNFINGELWGRFCSPNLPWGMIFPQSGSMLPRHPSQLYEAFCEGILLTIVLCVFMRKPRKLGQVSGVFAIGYGIIRFGLEFFRQPDAFATSVVQISGLSLGQYYSVPIILMGIVAYNYTNKHN